MAKKQFTSNLNDIFAPTTGMSKPMAKPSSITASIPKEEEPQEVVQRTTLLLNRDTYDAIRAIAHWERLQIKDLLQEALQGIVSRYSEEELAGIRREFLVRRKK